MADSLENVRERLSKLRRDFGGQEHGGGDRENMTGSLTNTMDPTMWLSKIAESGNKPEDWLEYLLYLEHRGQFVDLTNKYRTMWSAYNRAMKNIELDRHRRNEAYAQIVVKFAWLKETESVEEARFLFKFARGNIKPFAFVHVAAAQLEMKHNDIEKCKNILKKAKDIRAQPTHLLDAALEMCMSGGTILTPPPLDTNQRIKHEVIRSAPVFARVSSQEKAVPMEVDAPATDTSAATKVEAMQTPLVQKNLSPPVVSSAVDQSKADTTVSFNLPERRNRNQSNQSSSDEADTIPWSNNSVFPQMSDRNNSALNSAASNNPTRLPHTVCKGNSKRGSVGSLSMITPDCKNQGLASSSSVGQAVRRRPRQFGAATRIVPAQQQLVKQPSNDSDDDDDYFVDFQPLGKVSPPTEQTPMASNGNRQKSAAAMPPIMECKQLSSDSGVVLTPQTDKVEPEFLNSLKPIAEQPVQSLASQQQTPVAKVAPPTSASAVKAPPADASHIPSHQEPNVVAKQQPMVPPPAKKDAEPFVPPRMPPRKSKDTITVNGKHYSILSTIGKGGSSKVFEAFSEDKKVLAIKSVNLEYADDMTVKGYLNEITLLHKLRKDDHIIKLHDYEVTEHHLAIVMERGSVDLSTFLKRNKNINGKKIMFYWLEMLEAVEVVHKQGIIHSDLKPANFLFVEGKLKLIDFGIANAIQADKTSVVRESQVGTLNYMSPEAIQDTSPTPQVDARGHRRPRLKINCKSDVWSLGCILYYMVYGRTPFQHITNTLVKLQSICDPQHQINFPEIENELLLDVLKKCLIRSPIDRPSIQELLNHPYLKSGVQQTTEVPSQDSVNSLTMKHVQSLISQLTQLNSPNTLKTVSRFVMDQVATGQEINIGDVLKSKEQPKPPPVPPPISYPSSNVTPPLQSERFQQHQPPPPVSSSGMDYQQHYQHQDTPRATSGMVRQSSYQVPPGPSVNNGMVPTSYDSGCGGAPAFRQPRQTVAGEPLRPIARAPLQALRMDDVQRAHGNLQPVAQSSSMKYMTQIEKENNDLESLLRRQLAQKYQHAQPPQNSTEPTFEQSWTNQTMK